MENVILFSTPQAIAMMEETAKVVKYHPVTMKIAAIHSELFTTIGRELPY